MSLDDTMKNMLNRELKEALTESVFSKLANERDIIAELLKEKTELDDKIAALSRFRLGEKFMSFKSPYRSMLQRQLGNMESYSFELRERIMFLRKEL